MTEQQAILDTVDKVAASGPFTADWVSLKAYEIPEWYKDGKFGIFLHWGPYSVPAFGNEWYPRNMYKEGTPEFAHHVATYGAQDQFGYKDFIPQMRYENYDPEQYA
ncbi:MAG: alpha-L-fucosidase, partial [Fibrella sp.]|nr:alpha-L-fucosidase [Armatimonadota bacterium]